MELLIDRLSYGPVTLELLSARHRDDLRAAVDADPAIWEIYPYSLAGDDFDPWWNATMAGNNSGRIRFAVCLDGRCVGTTSYLNIDAREESADVGGTYYRPEARGGIVNPAAKLLMLGHAFDQGARRLVFQVDAINSRSRAAVLKLGATEEGVLRAHKRTWTGRIRDTVVFSILSDEWPAIERRLRARLEAYQT